MPDDSGVRGDAPDKAETPKSSRHRAFCERVVNNEPLGSAWAASATDVGIAPGTQAANNVSGSRMAARFAKFIAQMKAKRAALAAPAEDLDLEDVGMIMAEISDLLIESAMVAEESGQVHLSASLRAAALSHHNRAGRVQRVQGNVPDKTDAYDAEAALERVLCHCR